MKKLLIVLLVLIICFVLAQFIRPDIKSLEGPAPVPAQLLKNVPENVEAILRTSCYDCHTNNANFRWYDKITPVNFMVASDIREGRSKFSFANFNELSSAQKNGALYYALNKVLCGEMPLSDYTLMHVDARLSAEKIQTLKDYLVLRTPRKALDSTRMATGEPFTDKQATNVKPAPNGIEYVPGYRNWTAMSTTDRFDNGSMRIIFVNDVAVNAIRSGEINPWPDGTIFAKTAWWEQLKADGTIKPGRFIQVEFMIKDAEKYRATEGWGWARWRGNDLKPYGNGKDFDQECITCHSPRKNHDYVFTLPLNLGTIEHDNLNNQASVIPAGTLPENPLLEKVFNATINTFDSTMSSLYGNKTAWEYAITHDDHNYPPGAVLYEVTWKQEPDPVWFGANFPGKLLSVELVAFSDLASPVYTLYEGLPLKKSETPASPDRVEFITTQRLPVSP